MPDVASAVEQAAVSAAGAVTAAASVDIGDLNWLAIGIGAAIAGTTATVASVNRKLKQRDNEGVRYTWAMVVVDFGIGMIAGVLVFSLANRADLDPDSKLALMVAAGWTGQFALDRGKRLIERVFPS